MQDERHNSEVKDMSSRIPTLEM